MRPPKTPYLPKAQNGLLHYPFGMAMAGYKNEEFGYAYGMNTQEKDDEIYGEGNSYSAEYWQYDARLGRRWNVDPRPNPSISSYTCFGNNPIWFSDVYGDTVSNELQIKIDETREEANKKIEQLGKYKKDLMSLMVDGSDNNILWKAIDEADHAIIELQTFLTNLVDIENDSERNYHFLIDDSYTTAGVKILNGSITIVFPNLELTQNISLMSHEVKHLHQYYSGKLNYNTNLNVAGITYDIFDEIDAYRTQWAFSFFGSFFGETDIAYHEITLSNITRLHDNYKRIWHKSELNRATIMSDKIARHYSDYLYEGEKAKTMYNFLKKNYVGRPLGEFINNIEN